MVTVSWVSVRLPGNLAGTTHQPVHVTDSRNIIQTFNPLTPTVAIMGTAIKHPVPDRVKLSFVIFDIRAQDAL